MYKYLLTLFILISTTCSAQVISMSPAEDFQGQTFTAEIKLAPGVIQAANPPADSFDVYIQQGATRINCNVFSPVQIYPGTQPYTDSLHAAFTIPANVTPGWYDVHVITYNAGFLPVNNVLANAFVVRIPGSCAHPFNVQDSAVTDSSAYIYWSPSVIADTFRVRYKIFGTSNYFYKDINGAGVSGSTIKILMPGAKYGVDVSTICSGIHSTYSLPIDTFTTVGIPINCVIPYSLSISGITNTSATINWNTNIVSDTFRIRYKITGSPVFIYKNVNGINHSTTLTNLQPGTSYDVQVSSVCSGIGTGYCNVLSLNTLSSPVSCIVPFGISSSNVTASDATIKWSVNVTADTFRVRFKPVSGSTFSYREVPGTAGDSVVLHNLIPNTQYMYQVNSRCSGVSTAYSAGQNFTTLNSSVNCVIPFSVSSSSLTNTSALISWSNLITADTFRLRYNINGSPNFIYKDVSGIAGSSTTLSGLLPNTQYQYQVSSKCSGIGSGYSTALTFTTTNNPVNCTAIPYGLSTTNITNANATISWTPLVTADSFLVRYSVNGTTNYIWKMVSGTAGNTTTLTGLSPVTTYQWQVRTKCNGAPATSYSASVVFGTPLRLAGGTSENEDINIYPNPSAGNFRVEFNSDKETETIFEVTNYAGQIIYIKSIMTSTDRNSIDINLPGVAAGIYFLNIKNDSINLRRQIIVQ